MPNWEEIAADASERDRLVLEHVPLLRHIAGRLTLDLPGGVEREDLVGYGMVGLIRAAESYDPSRGIAFSTYAYPKIRGAILDELRRMDFLPRGRREKVRELERTVAELRHRDGAPPSPERIAEAMGLSVEEVDEILESAKSAVETSLDGGPDEELARLLVDPRGEDPVGTAEWNELKQRLAQEIAALPEQERSVITLYYAEELLLREIAEMLGVTESRVSQIHTRALFRLNQRLAEHVGSP